MIDFIESLLKRRKEEGEIRCPYCGAIQPNDDYQYPITYWGDDGVVEWKCVECEKQFFVEERVERTYIVGRTIDCNGYIEEV